MHINDEPYIFVHALHWRRSEIPLVMAQRHGLLVLEEFDKTNEAQRWRLGRNGEIYTSIRNQHRYIQHGDGCAAATISRDSGGGWAFDTLGEHPYKYRVVPRACPSYGLRATLGSRVIGIEPAAYMDDSNGWYIVPWRSMAESRNAHVRPMT